MQKFCHIFNKLGGGGGVVAGALLGGECVHVSADALDLLHDASRGAARAVRHAPRAPFVARRLWFMVARCLLSLLVKCLVARFW